MIRSIAFSVALFAFAVGQIAYAQPQPGSPRASQAPACKAHPVIWDPIDYIVLDEQALKWVDQDSFTIMDFDAADKPDRKKISDHCPLFVDLIIPEG